MSKKEKKKEYNCKDECACDFEKTKKSENQEMEENTKLDELTNDLKRVQAEFENYQKRVEKEFIVRDERTRANLLCQNLVVLDALNEGIKHEEKNEGLKKVREVFVKFLHDNGVQKMTKKEGDLFDHDEMECIVQGKDEKKKDGEVLEVIQKGYFINDKVLRFAKVRVNKL